MPSVSKKQHNFMAAIAKNPAFAKKVGLKQSVGKHFLEADRGKKFREGGEMKESKAMMKKEISFMKKKGAPKSMIKHEEAEAMCGGGKAMKKMAAGGVTAPRARKIADEEVAKHEKCMHKMAGGGVARADGCIMKGHTKGKMV